MSQGEKCVKLGEIIREFDLEILHEGTDYENVPLRTLDVNRPGLPLTGFFEHFDTQRLLVIGLTEHTFLENMSPEQRRVSFDRVLAYPVP
ncbi:MAG: HPr kinase/phosphorylase, partial [Oscillibacter sp.]|nr:HPr kinase/phosphorylase [Oscillibacter sp.]